MSQGALGRRPPWAAFLIAAGLAGLAAVMLWDAGQLRQGGGYSGVGPASVPRIVAFGLLGLAGWTVVAALRGGHDPAPPQAAAPVLWVLAGLGLQLLLLHSAGFVIATAALFACTARGFGQRNFGLAFGVGLGLAAFVYVMFDRLLRLNLPGGPLERLVFGG